MATPFQDGMAAYQRGDYVSAMLLWRPLADRGNAAAQLYLGIMYDEGWGVPEDDAAAFILYRKAADQGNADAQFYLAGMYDNGRPREWPAAANWLRKAAEQGHARAQFNLGQMLEKGQGVPQDYAAASVWYRKAADQGNASAQTNLGFFYEQGRAGLPKDDSEAARLYKLAADQGNAWARAALLRLGRRQPEKERQRQGDVAVQGATTATTHNNTKSELTWTQILETKGTVTQHITIIWNKLTTSQKISIAVVISLLFMFRYEGPPSDAGPSLARAESVYVKYRGEVDLSAFDCTDVKRSSFIRRVCYDSLNAYMIVRLDGTYYHYCDVDDGIVNAFLAAGSMGRFFDTSIKGHFDCRNGHIPAY